MTRSIATVIALILIAGAAGLLGGWGSFAPGSGPGPKTDLAPRFGAEAMIVLTAADTDRGRPGIEKKSKSKSKKSPPAAAEAKPTSGKVLPERHQYSDAVELVVLMAGGFAVGLAGFVFGRVWTGIITAGFAGLAIGAAVYSFAFGSTVAQPNITVAAALLIFSASALAPSLLGRAGLVALRKLFPGQQG